MLGLTGVSCEGRSEVYVSYREIDAPTSKIIPVSVTYFNLFRVDREDTDWETSICVCCGSQEH